MYKTPHIQQLASALYMVGNTKLSDDLYAVYQSITDAQAVIQGSPSKELSDTVHEQWNGIGDALRKMVAADKEGGKPC